MSDHNETRRRLPESTGGDADAQLATVADTVGGSGSEDLRTRVDRIGLAHTSPDIVDSADWSAALLTQQSQPRWLALPGPINLLDRIEKIWIDDDRPLYVGVLNLVLVIHAWAVGSSHKDTVPVSGLEVE